MKVVHYRLNEILMHPSLPKVPASKVQPPLTGQALYIFDSIFKSKGRQFLHQLATEVCMTRVTQSPPKHREEVKKISQECGKS